jgi:transcriptional regulator with XRE-family HTH domain
MADDRFYDSIDEYQATLTEDELEEVAAASVALDLARLAYSARERRGLTQVQAAEFAGVKQQMVSRLEGGTAQPTFRTFERYLRRLGFALHVSLIDEQQRDIADGVVLNDDAHPAAADLHESTPVPVEQR